MNFVELIVIFFSVVLGIIIGIFLTFILLVGGGFTIISKKEEQELRARK